MRRSPCESAKRRLLGEDWILKPAVEASEK